MRILISFFFLCLCSALRSQSAVDPWMHSQLGRICWEQTYEGVLADYHPIMIILATDSNQVAGYLIHQGDKKSHRLLGEWKNKDDFQLQERDEFDRLTGYLKGSISHDQVNMQWISADQSRIFDIIAFPKSLIKIQNFKPSTEWIQIASTPPISVSVQKMDYGIVTGLAHRNNQFEHFEGYCLDGKCSIWNTVLQNAEGAPLKVQMRQRDTLTYKVNIDGKDYVAAISAKFPLTIRQFDNSSGFLDFIYPSLGSKTYDQWVSQFVDKTWNEGVKYLTSLNQSGTKERLVHRSSGWIEILDAGDNYISGIATYINPGSTRRETFVLLKKEDVLLSLSDLLNSTSDMNKAESLAMASSGPAMDDDYKAWLQKAGYKYLIPTRDGIVMLTEFNMVYGDAFRLLTLEQSKEMIKKKYWKNFGWL